jgi:hypothetical protein
MRKTMAILAAWTCSALVGAAQSPFAPVGPDKILETDWKAARAVELVPASTVWKIDRKPAPQVKMTSTTPIALSPKPGDAAFTLVLNRDGTHGAVGYKVNKGESSRVVLCDLRKSTVVSRTEMPGAWIPLSLSDDAKYVVMRRFEAQKGSWDRLQIWDISGKEATKLLEFTPYPNFKTASRDIRLATFLPGNRLMTLGGVALVTWDLKTGKAIYKLPIQPESLPALSPDQKLLAFTTKTDVGIMDVEAGKVLVSQPVPRQLPLATMAFSPDGLRIACFATDNIFIWNVADGSLYRDIPAAGWTGSGKALGWTSNKDLRIGGNLIDIELQMRYWEYKGFLRAATANELTWFLLPIKGGGGALIPAEVPHEAARKTLEKAAADPNILVLKPGTKVKIDVSGLADAKERDRAFEALKARLEKNGCKADPNGTIDLVASTQASDSTELRYKTVGAPADAPIRTFKFDVYFARLKFVHQGATVWESSAHNLPGDIQLEEGETVAQHLKKNERPKYEFYQTVELPRLLLRSKGTDSLGSSQVTVSGVR